MVTIDILSIKVKHTLTLPSERTPFRCQKSVGMENALSKVQVFAPPTVGCTKVVQRRLNCSSTFVYRATCGDQILIRAVMPIIRPDQR